LSLALAALGVGSSLGAWWKQSKRAGVGRRRGRDRAGARSSRHLSAAPNSDKYHPDPFPPEPLLPPSQSIIASYRQAAQLAVAKVKELSVSLEGKSDAEKRELLIKCASTSLNSKLVRSLGVGGRAALKRAEGV
jgi:hypothetical protein